jgi:hypothetical protein
MAVRIFAVGVLSTAAALYEAPCDILSKGGTPCVAAHSTTRQLVGPYGGPLYQVKRESDGATKDIFLVADGSLADAAAQDDFCANISCTIVRIYDQSPNGNDLTPAPGGGANKNPDRGVNASADRVYLKDQKTGLVRAVYGAKFEGQMGYRNDNTKNIAVNNDPETMYWVVSGRHYNDLCCFDYGNAETNNLDDGEGTMEALYWGASHGWGDGAGSPPWVSADLENGIWAGREKVTPTNTRIDADFVLGMLKGGAENHFALKGADANSPTLLTLYDGARPANPAYEVMKKQGAIILGIGGDNSNGGIGTFYEGVMTAGWSLEATDAGVHANVVASGYRLSQATNGKFLGLPVKNGSSANVALLV